LSARRPLTFTLMATVAGAALAGACGGGGSPTPSSCFVGDMTAAPELELVYRTTDGMAAPLADGGEVPLLFAPQGGFVLFVGARARNIDGCTLSASSALVDPATSAVLTFERRPVTLAPTADGWLEPSHPDQLSNYSNLPACPLAGLTQAIDGVSYELQLQVLDGMNRMAQKTVTVTPTCAEPVHASQCQCQCAAGYVLGSACPPPA
jgi:hypothetical protein